MKYKIETFRGYKITHDYNIALLAQIAMTEELEREGWPKDMCWASIKKIE